MANEGAVPQRPEDILHTPYVLEFAGLEDKAAYHESDLESAVIGKMQKFLLELGKGFLFEQRQKRFTFNDKNFYVDLVLYNRLLRLSLIHISTVGLSDVINAATVTLANDSLLERLSKISCISFV